MPEATLALSSRPTNFGRTERPQGGNHDSSFDAA
ncbi:hypothetical protein L286_17840 [Sphingobium sp. HDIP04]|nr:hypothetical protein L286_17840 [Sphingobium sp. HDIP04]